MLPSMVRGLHHLVHASEADLMLPSMVRGLHHLVHASEADLSARTFSA